MAYTLQLLHANDLEGGVEALENAPNFAAIVDTLEDTHENTILLSAGDNYIPGPFFSTAADFSMGATLTAAYERFYTELLGVDPGDITLDLGRGGGRVDVTIMNVLGFDASAVGNHEFDPGTSAFADIINAEGGEGTVDWVGALFPYLSSNIDFSGDANLGGLFTDEILTSDSFAESLGDLAAGNIGPAIAPATLIEENGELIGVVGATTQIIETISSTGGTDEITGGANNMAALAAVIQPQIDALIAAGSNKIILTSHLQQIALEKELAGLLDGVDIIIAGGSNTLQADAQDRLRDGDEAAEGYPFLTQDANGNDVAIVSTDGEYSYLGRLVVEFDEDGNLMTETIDENVSGTFATDTQGVLDVTGADTLEEAIDGSLKADIVEDLTSAVQTIVEAADAIAFGNHEVFLDGRRETVRTEESNLGNLTADANLAAARAADAGIMVSFKNGGGIRAEIGSATNEGTDEGDGILSQLDLQNSLRFDNGLVTASVTKEGFLMLLEHGVADTDTEAGNTPGRFFQIGGFRVSFDEAGTAQELATDETGDFVVDPETGMPQVATAGNRIQTVALTDPETGADIVIFRDGAFTAEAPDDIRLVTLDFLLLNNGDGYPFQELVSDVRFLTPEGGLTADPEADRLGEQEALGDFMQANFPDEDNAFAQAETDVFNDLRIVQLARNGGEDRILLDEVENRLDIELAQVLESGETELFTGGSEVVSTEDGLAFVTNGAQGRIDVFDIATGEKLRDIDLNGIEGFDGVQSVAVKGGLVAAAISVSPEDQNGVVAIFDTEGNLQSTVEVGNLPDMVTFTPDGSKILVANEGEPLEESDPLGGVSIIDLQGGEAAAPTTTFTLQGFAVTQDADDDTDGEDDFDPVSIAPVTIDLEFAEGVDSLRYSVVGFDDPAPAIVDFGEPAPLSIRVDGEVALDDDVESEDSLTGFETAEGTRHAILVLEDPANDRDLIFFVGGDTPPPFETAEDLIEIVNAGSFFVIDPADPLLGGFAPDQDIPLSSFNGVEVTENAGGSGEPTVTTLDFTGFDGQEDALREAGVLIEPGKSVSEDLEPEYITVLPDGATAWVALQEANAYAVVDLTTNEVTDIRSFGLVDRSLPGFEIDASNRDDAINLQNYDNLFGMRQPDAITAIEIGGETFILTANEGDARDATESRVADLTLDPTAFPNAEILQLDENLGRLNVRNDLGDTDGDGDFDQLFHYGSRSFTIYNEAGEIVHDSGSLFSRLIAEIRPALFNQDEGDFDDRSDDKGVEPEAIAAGEVGGRYYAFIGLERDNGIMVFDITDPTAPVFDQYLDSEANGNISPETIQFIPAGESVTGQAQLAVAFEGDGNTVILDLDFGLDVEGSPLGETLTGSDRADLIGGRAGDDVIAAGAGDDTVNGGIGDDEVMGEGGDDRIILRAGDDTADGGDGADIISGNAGADTLSGGAGDDLINGGIGDDNVSGDAGDDRIILLAGNDTADGGDGNDIMSGNAGNDTLSGGAGDDLINGGIGDDRMDGGAGNDTLIGAEGADTFVFASGGGSDIFRGFTGGADVAASDRLELDEALWLDSVGTLDAAAIVAQFAAVNEAGFVEFAFAEAEGFELLGVTETTGLENYIDIV